MRQRIIVIPAAALGAGLLSSLLSALAGSAALGGSLLAPFLPLLPVMAAGFAYGIAGLSSATLAALVATPILTGFEAGFSILAVQIFPTWLFMRELLKARLDPVPGAAIPYVRWAPPGNAFTAVALYGSLVTVITYALDPAQFTVFLADIDALCSKITADMHYDTTQLTGPNGAGLREALVVVSLWLALFMLYAAACLANFIVLSFRPSARPSLRFTPYTPRGYVLVAMGSAALIGLFGPSAGSLTDMARIVCLLLLLPYLVSGMGSIHAALSRWQHPFVWQIGFYLMLLTVWPAFPVALYGIVRQVSRLTAPPPR